MRLALAANRASGRRLDRSLRRRRRAEAESSGSTTLDADRAPSAPERIAVAGGDGTIGPVAELAGRLDVPLAVIPTGTANDFARAHGLPLDLDAAARLAAHRRRTLRALELGRLADGRPFVNVASAGLVDASPARRAQPLKSRFGPLAYGARRRPRRRRPAQPLRVHACASTASAVFDGERLAGDRRLHRRVRRRLGDRRGRRRPTASSTS